MMDTDTEVKKVIHELQSGHGSNLYSALIMIRTTLIKSKNSLTQLVQMGAVQLLIQLLENPRRHMNQTKTTDIVMSILANLCLEEDVREKVVCCEGVSVIARVTLAAEQESIQNRGVRALANLALDISNCEKIFEMEVPAFVAKRLMESEDAECRSTYCRALQLFGQTGKDAKRLMEDTQAIQALAALLKLDNRKLALKSLRILSELSALCCCPSFTAQILAANILEELVNLADDDDSSCASCSLAIIFRLCEQEIMRPALGSAGIISLLVKLMRSEKSFVNKVLALNALCLCTKEAVNRNKIQEAGGLELFISALNIHESGLFSKGQFSMLYDRMISSLVNFLYNDECLGKLLELGLVKILLEHLKRSCAFTSVTDDLRKEIDSFATIFESNSAERNKQFGMPSITASVDGVNSSSNHKGISTDLDKNSASCSFIEFSNVSVQHKGVIDDLGNACLQFPLNTPDVLNQINTPEVSTENLHTYDEEKKHSIAEDNVEMVEDVEDEMLENSPENLEMPSQLSSEARYTFSINSPTYQMETAWRLEDYTSGITCKSFHQEPNSDAQQRSSSPFSFSPDLLQAPYSPLSVGASYYSPSQSSPSPSVLTSPVQSTILSSPTSAPRDSPTWGYSSPESENIPMSAAPRLFSPQSAASLSPLPLAYQNQFSPLANNLPVSPVHFLGERYSQSPTPSSQMSLFSQDSSVPHLEKHLPSLDTAGAAEHIDQMLAASETTTDPLFNAVHLSQNTLDSENVYSASEEDDDDDDSNICSDVGSALNPSSTSNDESFHKKSELCKKIMDPNSSTDKYTKDLMKVMSNKRATTVNDNFPSAGNSTGDTQDLQIAENSKRRRLNCKSLTRESCRESSSAGHNSKYTSVCVNNDKSSCSVVDTCLTDDDDKEITSASQSLAVINPDTHGGKVERVVNSTLAVIEPVELCIDKELHRPSSAGLCSTPGFENVQKNIFQRVASFPGKVKRPIKTSHFRKHSSGTAPSTSWTPGSPMAALAHMTDSPYRSPYTEPAYSNIASSQDSKNPPETNTAKSSFRNNSEDLFAETSSPKSGSSSKALIIQQPRKEEGAGNKRDTATAASTDQGTNDARAKKIHRATEASILILLARVSVKTNPTQLLTDNTVTNCLLGYISSAPNPIHRSCRILYRLCSNPHCFEKLILMQMPALLVTTLVFDSDGTFPHDRFHSDNRSIADFLPSSPGSELSGSQTSEFGRKMDFEFGGDAYSTLTSTKHSSLRSIFQNRNVLVDSEVSRSSNRDDSIYEAGSSRVEARVRIGLELLHTLGAVAMSKFGEGEIQHLLMRHSAKNQLACIISMLHLQVGWCPMTRDKMFAKYSLWDKVLPCLFTSEAPLLRETIVAAISLQIHIDNPPKLTPEVTRLPVCPDLKNATGCEMSLEEPLHRNSKQNTKLKLSVQRNETVRSSNAATSFKSINKDGVQANECTTSQGNCDKNTNGPSSSSNTATFCPYQNMSDQQDVCFFITDENGSLHKIHAHRKTLMEKSEVFAAMFCGSYAESSQSEITVEDVDRDAFEFVIHYLHGCSSDCFVIASLNLEHIRNEIVAAEICVSSEVTGSSSAGLQHDRLICDTEIKVGKDLPEMKEDSGVLSEGFRPKCEGVREAGYSERSSKTETPTHISQVLEFTQSQDSLDSLTLEDKPDIEVASHACRKLHFQNTLTITGEEHTEATTDDQNGTGLSSGELSGINQRCLQELISRCENILALADRFLLHDLMCYLASVLSHGCLCDGTIEEIFHLACFYHLDCLAFDCIRETLMSGLSCSNAAAVYVELADDGYREQVHTALTWLVKHANPG